jgi:hypothetical protein
MIAPFNRSSEDGKQGHLRGSTMRVRFDSHGIETFVDWHDAVIASLNAEGHSPGVAVIALPSL